MSANVNGRTRRRLAAAALALVALPVAGCIDEAPEEVEETEIEEAPGELPQDGGGEQDGGAGTDEDDGTGEDTDNGGMNDDGEADENGEMSGEGESEDD